MAHALESGGSPKIKLSELVRLRLVAIRRGFWFRVLSRLDRGLVDLALKVAKDIRSEFLAKEISSVVKRLLEAFEGKIAKQMREVGVPLAEKMSRFAQNWGNRSARGWASDSGFIRYLTIMKLNACPCDG